MKTLFRTVLITIAITATITLGMRVTGVLDGFFYWPNTRTYDPPRSGWPDHTRIRFPSTDGTELTGWFFPPSGAARNGTVIHYHGSNGNIAYTARNLLWLVEEGYGLFAFDYRGYGESEGSPDREGVLLDAEAAYDYVAKELPDIAARPIILFGQSMGGQLAIRVAANASEKPLAVISEATYANHADHSFDMIERMDWVSIFRWPVWLATSNRLSADQAIGDIGCPILLIHSTNDKSVRSYHSERLYNLANDPKQFWPVEVADHLTIFKNQPNSEIYRPSLISYLSTISNNRTHRQ
jgi:alpha-beta hydrolase superfamily lysophospholipase